MELRFGIPYGLIISNILYRYKDFFYKDLCSNNR